MKHPARQNSPHRRRRIHHNRFPYIRFATVLAVSKRSPFSPSLLLRGDWLTEAGFLPHCRVRITVHAQRLVIEPLLGIDMGDSSSPLKPFVCTVNGNPQPTTRGLTENLAPSG
jgi:hypothetical protein